LGLRDRITAKIGKLVGAGPGSSPRPPTPSARLGEADGEGFVAVLPAASLPEGKGLTVAAGGQNVAVFRASGRLFAIDDACRHEDGPLGEGRVVGGVVTCPYHDWRYDLGTGACLTDPSRPVSCYAIREREGHIWVGARLRAGSEARGGEHDDGLKTAPVGR
jgi:nitrite reductase/ring-hydroxylating ferredoxin subunit